MASQTEIYEFLKRRGEKFTTKELQIHFRDRHIGTKLRQLFKFKLIQAENVYIFRVTEWWVEKDD